MSYYKLGCYGINLKGKTIEFYSTAFVPHHVALVPVKKKSLKTEWVVHCAHCKASRADVITVVGLYVSFCTSNPKAKG